MSLRRWAPFVSLLVAAPASAGGVPAIAYVAEPECPTRVDAERRLTETLGAAATRSDLPALEPSVTIVRRDSGYAATVVIRDGEHETTRELEDASCALVVDAAALIIAVALVPELVPFDDDAEPVEPVPDVTETLGPAVEPAETPPPGPSLSGALRLAAHGALGVLPGVVVGGEVAGGIRYDALLVELSVRGLPLAAARFGVDPSLGADLALATGLLRALAVVALDEHFELHAGGGVDVGVALGRGVGISVPRDAAAPWVALEGAVGAAWVPLRQFAFVLDVELLVPVVRPVFVASGLGTLYRPEVVAGALRLGVEGRFP